MAVSPRFPIARLMVLVSFAAADFGVLRALWGYVPDFIIAVTALPMANLLLLALPKARPGRPGAPFWLGFEVFGWSAVGLYVLAAFEFDRWVFAPIRWVGEHEPFRRNTDAEAAFLFSFAVIFYTIPQLLAAVGGGRLSTRYRIVIQRRDGGQARRLDHPAGGR